MAQTSEDMSANSVEYICLQDVLHSFNNSISEEQAWAVCHQCAQYFLLNSAPDKFRDLYYYGTTSIRVSKEGDVKIEVKFNQGSGKGPPQKRNSFSLSREFKTLVTQNDAIQALGTAIYKALDFGLCESEEPHLSSDLEDLIEFLTDHPTDEDEGIDVERDSVDSQGREHSVFHDIIDLCVHHLSSSQQPGALQHYRAVCHALATEALELLTFLDNISSNQSRLASTSQDTSDGLDDLQRADWARLWVQMMRELRHGVRLKKVEQVHLTPVEFELTPFEIILEDIRSGRFKLNRIMVNGDIPPKVKSDAHAVILDFIRSRPPLKSAKKRVLKNPPKQQMEPRELLLEDICRSHTLKPVRKGKRVVGARRPRLDCDNESSEEDSPKPVRKVIKPIAAFQVSTDDSDSYLSDSDDDGRHHVHPEVMSPLSPADDVNPGRWRRTVARDLVTQDPSISCHAIARRHTISACDAKIGRKVSTSSQHASVFEEDEDVPASADSFVRGQAARKPTKLVSYRKQHDDDVDDLLVHERKQCMLSSQNLSSATQQEVHAGSELRHAGHSVLSKSHGHLATNVVSRTRSCVHDLSSARSDVRRSSRSVSVVAQPPRSASPDSQPIRSHSPCRRVSRAESPVRHLSRSETFSYSIPHRSRHCVRNETYISTRCDSPQTRHLTRSDTFPPPLSESSQDTQRDESPRRHSVHQTHNLSSNTHLSASERPTRHSVPHEYVRTGVNNACDSHHGSESSVKSRSCALRRHASNIDACELSRSRHARCTSPTRKESVSQTVDLSSRHHGNRSRSHSPSDRLSHSQTGSVSSSQESVRSSRSSLQDVTSASDDSKKEVGTKRENVPSQHLKTGLVRARSKPEMRLTLVPVHKDEEDKHFEIIERSTWNKDIQHRERPASALELKQSSNGQTYRSISARSRLDRSSMQRLIKDEPMNTGRRAQSVLEESQTGGEDSAEKPKRGVRLSRQTAIRTERRDVRLGLKSTNSSSDNSSVTTDESRVRRVGSRDNTVILDRDSTQEMPNRCEGDSVSSKQQTQIGESAKHETSTGSYEGQSSTKQRMSPSEKLKLRTKRPEGQQPVRPILRSRSEVRSRSEMKPVKGSHTLRFESDISDSSNVKYKVSSADHSDSPLDLHERLGHLNLESGVSVDSGTLPEIDEVPEVIKTSRAEFKVTDLLHVSWKSERSERVDPTNQSNPTSSACLPSPHKWQNPIECLSLTLEEVTHIRMVLTKAELETLTNEQDLYNQVSKGKVCFTCRKVKFSLFGQWGTKCKFCQRTICNYCLRKMSVPTEHFEKIPVYTLSPVPLSADVMEALKVYESTGSVPHSPMFNRKGGASAEKGGASMLNGGDSGDQTTPTSPSTPQSGEKKVAEKRKSLQRSHTIGVGSRPPPNKALLKGPQMSICCDCKSMIMEIIRASRSSISVVTNSSSSSESSPEHVSNTPTPTDTPRRPVTLRQRASDLQDKPRPRSMLDHINFRSFNFTRSGTDA